MADRRSDRGLSYLGARTRGLRPERRSEGGSRRHARRARRAPKKAVKQKTRRGAGIRGRLIGAAATARSSRSRGRRHRVGFGCRRVGCGRRRPHPRTRAGRPAPSRASGASCPAWRMHRRSGGHRQRPARPTSTSTSIASDVPYRAPERPARWIASHADSGPRPACFPRKNGSSGTKPAATRERSRPVRDLAAGAVAHADGGRVAGHAPGGLGGDMDAARLVQHGLAAGAADGVDAGSRRPARAPRGTGSPSASGRGFGCRGGGFGCRRVQNFWLSYLLSVVSEHFRPWALRKAARDVLGPEAKEEQIEARADKSYYGDDEIDTTPETRTERQQRQREFAEHLAEAGRCEALNP